LLSKLLERGQKGIEKKNKQNKGEDPVNWNRTDAIVFNQFQRG
jgi:hypothetical protein